MTLTNVVKKSKAATQSSGNSPCRELIVGDCLKVLPEMLPASVKLLLTDPPFNIGLKYPGYDDSKSPAEYGKMLRDFAREARRVLMPDGSIFLFMGQKNQAKAFCILEDAGLFWRNSIVWHYGFGPCQTKKFTPSWTLIHNFSCHPKKFTFNADAVRVPSARQLVYCDKRANPNGKVPNDTWVLQPEESYEHFRPDQDVVLESRVCGTFHERAGHTTQLPLALVDRIVRVASNPGDLILDPFAGSGTVLVSARNLGRRYLGIEISPQTAEIARQRLAEAS